jgi:hypothetical protein
LAETEAAYERLELEYRHKNVTAEHEVNEAKVRFAAFRAQFDTVNKMPEATQQQKIEKQQMYRFVMDQWRRG